MAPRQHMRKMKVGKVTFTEAYKAVNEYRQKFPQKTVTFYAQNYPAMGWAVFMAGGSCPVIPCTDKAFLKDAAAQIGKQGDTVCHVALHIERQRTAVDEGVPVVQHGACLLYTSHWNTLRLI